MHRVDIAVVRDLNGERRLSRIAPRDGVCYPSNETLAFEDAIVRIKHAVKSCNGDTTGGG